MTKISMKTLLLSVAMSVFTTGTASAQSAANVDAINLLLGFSQLGNTAAGRTALDQNLNTAVAINNNSTVAQRNQAISDNTTASLIGGSSNGVNLADGLGPQLLAVYKTKNSAAQNFSSTTVSANVAALFSQLNAITTASDSAVAKNFFANGTRNGTVAATGVSLPAGGVFNVYDKAYNPLPANANAIGDSRPVQVAPGRIQSFTGPDYFGVSTDTATIFPTLKTNASFPSGHSSSGFTSSLLLAMMVPERYKQELTRGAEFGTSRIVLGVHYPLDVIGARIHTIYALTQALNNNPNYLNQSLSTLLGQPLTTTGDFKALFAAATTDVRALLDTCTGGIAVCAAATSGDRFADAAKNKADYLYSLTYGLAAVGPTNLDPVVPVGAEVLIATRFPYLSSAQLRDVLATTEIASGQALDDGSGYARLNLYDAADGYGAFKGTVTVTMDAAKGGVNAYDVWANAIGDYKAPSTGVVTPGSLVKNGSGTLELSGNDSWSGSTTVNGGMLLFTGTSKLTGALVNNSVVSVTRNDGTVGRTLTVGDYTGGAGSQLVIAAQLAGAGSKGDQLVITGNVTAGSKTTINLIDVAPTAAGGYDPTGIPIVVVTKGKTASADNFVLSGGSVRKGLFEYKLAFDADPRWLLVSLPTANTARLSTLATSTQDAWSDTASLWTEHQENLRDALALGKPRRALWGSLYHSWGDRDAANTITSYASSFAANTSYKKKTSAFVIGVDGVAEGLVSDGDSLVFGLSGGYIDASQTFFDGATTKLEGPTIGASATYTGGRFFADLLVKADLLRLRFADTRLAPTANHADTQTIGTTATIGYKLPLGSAVTLEPVAALSYVHSNIDALRIAGADVRFNDKEALRGKLGLRVNGVIMQNERSRLFLSAFGNWSTHLSGKSTATIASGASAPLLTLTDEALDDLGRAGAKLDYVSAAGWSIFAKADHTFGKDYNSTSLQAGVRVGF